MPAQSARARLVAAAAVVPSASATPQASRGASARGSIGSRGSELGVSSRKASVRWSEDSAHSRCIAAAQSDGR